LKIVCVYFLFFCQLVIFCLFSHTTKNYFFFFPLFPLEKKKARKIKTHFVFSLVFGFLFVKMGDVALPPIKDVPQGDLLTHYLRQYANLEKMKSAVQRVEAQLKPLKEKVIKILESAENKRSQFHLGDSFNPDETKQIGSCLGLRLAPKTRNEPLSAKALKEKLEESLSTRLQEIPGIPALSEETVLAFHSKVNADLASARTRKFAYELKIIVPPTAEDGRKKRKDPPQNSQQSSQYDSEELPSSQQDVPPLRSSQPRQSKKPASSSQPTPSSSSSSSVDFSSGGGMFLGASSNSMMGMMNPQQHMGPPAHMMQQMIQQPTNFMQPQKRPPMPRTSTSTGPPRLNLSSAH